MTMENAGRRIAVVGMGPRGLGALEALAECVEGSGLVIDLDIFDPVAHAGAGPNFSPDQSELCLLNLPVREISLEPPGYAGAHIGDFSGFLSPVADPETYPARACLGRYLAARFDDLVHNAQSLHLTQHKLPVERITNSSDGWWVDAADRRFGPYEEVLLTQGQPGTVPDDQLARWQSHARNVRADLVSAYPANALLLAARGWAGRTVAIRGLGLSTLDVLRLLTCGMGGRFDNGRYHRSGREPARIVPFSLDGQPPLPKPADAALDATFDPTPEETSALESALVTALAAEPETALLRICEAFVVPSMRILDTTGSSASLVDVQEWLATERDTPGAQETLPPAEALRTGIDMAGGRVPPSPGFVIGQLWRKWQNALRRGFNPARISPDTATALIGFDEGLKRYSYGPPIRSARELLMLIEAGMVDLRAADDPDIQLTRNGWQLVEDDASVTASAMVDAVMPPPALERSDDPVITKLMDEGRICAVADGLGAQTGADGQLLDHNGDVQHGLALLGRLALGSVIAVDSIHDCVGAATRRWADGVITRFG